LAYEPQFPAPRVVIQRGNWLVHRYTFTLESTRDGRGRIKLQVENTQGDSLTYQKDMRAGDDLAKIFKDERLRGFVVGGFEHKPEPMAVFENRERIYQGVPKTYESAAGQKVREQVIAATRTTYPVFDLIGRATRETGLTRVTVNQIFRRLPLRVKEKIFWNPEGFAGVFIAVIRNTLADAVAESLEFVVQGKSAFDREELFPIEKPMAQRELRGRGCARAVRSGPDRLGS
jgi:type III restriction enzyme